MAAIMGITSLKVPKVKGERIPSEQLTHKLSEIVLETMWDIWKIRNERIFTEQELSEAQAIDRWKTVIREKLTVEWRMIEKTNYPAKTKLREAFANKWATRNYPAQIERIDNIARMSLTI